MTTDLDRIDLERVHHWLSQDAPWAMGRSRATVELAARNSLNFGVLDAVGELRAYARVVTDHATFAWLCDVYVDPGARGHGLGRLLVDTVVAALQPLRLKRVLLATDNAHELYRKVGFTALASPDKWMIVTGQTP